jgi:hypothetical protein
MVTENLSVPFKIVNGSEGHVTDIKYRQDEKGRHFAAVVCISIPGCHVHVLGLSRGTVPIFPSSTSIKHQTHTGQTTAKSFSRRQVPLVPAYSYTDYESQGRTLTRAIVDVASARGQGVYVMLSVGVQCTCHYNARCHCAAYRCLGAALYCLRTAHAIRTAFLLPFSNFLLFSL